MDANIITLYELSVFNKKTFFDTITDDVGVLSKSTLEKYLKKYLESGEIVRIGRNAYCVRGKLKDYEYDYSDIEKISNIIEEDQEVDDNIIENKPLLMKMSANAKKHAITDANKRIYEVLMQLYTRP